jgi:hypothetical protein
MNVSHFPSPVQGNETHSARLGLPLSFFSPLRQGSYDFFPMFVVRPQEEPRRGPLAMLGESQLESSDTIA